MYHVLPSITDMGCPDSPELFTMVEIENIPPLVIILTLLFLWGMSIFAWLVVLPWIASGLMSLLPPGV